MRFSRQGDWSGLPFPSPWDLPNPRIEPWSALQEDSLPTELQGKPPKEMMLKPEMLYNTFLGRRRVINSNWLLAIVDRKARKYPINTSAVLPSSLTSLWAMVDVCYPLNVISIFRLTEVMI